MKTCINLFGMATVVLIVPAPFAAFDADHVRVVRDGADVLIESNGLPNHTSSYWSNTHERTLDGITTRTAETDHPLFVEPSCTSYDQMAPGNIEDFNGSYSMTVPAQPTRASFPATSPEARFIASSTTALVLAFGLALAVALAVGGWLAGRTVRPLRTLTDAARAMLHKGNIGGLSGCLRATPARATPARATPARATPTRAPLPKQPARPLSPHGARPGPTPTKEIVRCRLPASSLPEGFICLRCVLRRGVSSRLRRVAGALVPKKYLHGMLPALLFYPASMP